MTLETAQKAAKDALEWMSIEREQIAELTLKYGYCDGWVCVHALHHVRPYILKYEDICEIVAEIGRIRMADAVAMRKA